jgi:hypothetical protein
VGSVDVSTLGLRAIRATGLEELWEARRSLDLVRVRRLSGQLDSADLLAVGALADTIRSAEVGDVVGVYAGISAEEGSDVVTIGADDLDGPRRAFVLLRVAKARIMGPRAARVRVDWTSVGIELAQVALGFGASELCGATLNRRGLPIAEGSVRKVKGAGLVASTLLKQREIFALVRAAGREPVDMSKTARPAGDNWGGHERSGL